MADETPSGKENGRSVSDRAENGEQAEMFPSGVVDGDKRTPGNVIKTGLKTELEAEMTAHRVDLRNGLLDVDKLVRYAVTMRPGKITQVPHREKQPDGSDKTTSWTVVQKLKPVYMEALGMGEEAMTVAFRQLLAIDATRAGKCLDELQSEFTEYMRSGERAA
jgi:hypothetical protein